MEGKETKMGRPKKELSLKEFQQFEQLCAIQCTQSEICNILNITDKTLNNILKEKYGGTFSECFERFSATGKMSLRRKQFKLADKSAAMAIFLGKQYLGQRDEVSLTQDIEVKDDALSASLKELAMKL